VSKKNRSAASKIRVRPALSDEDARVWLRANNYSDIAERIDEVMMRWKSEGKRTRRNWWEILSGDKYGNPRIAGGEQFPVLRAARIRQGLDPDVAGAVCRNPTEEAPPVRKNPRWGGKQRHASI
jgi:hypothetical protein